MNFIFLFVSLAFAQGPDCNSVRNHKDFYLCSLSKHPLFEVSKLKAQEGEALVERAGQWENPELSYKSVSGDNQGDKVKSEEISANVSLSQLWQREARKDVAKAEEKIAKIESRETLLNAKKSLIRDLYRLRQIEEELELTNEALTTFETIRKQFKSRLVRGAEQEISLNIVELASSDYELKRNQITIERSAIIARLKTLWGPAFEPKKQFLPPRRESWPGLSSKNLGPSFETQKISAESDRALAEYNLAARESWPNVSAGPSIEKTAEGSNQVTQTGFNVSVTVPIFSQNGGSRRLADVKSDQAMALQKYATKKSDLEKSILIQKYDAAVQSLVSANRANDVKKKHHRIDSLFRKGLAAGNLVVEAHRQISEYTTSQHEHENTALETYLEIKTLSGEEIEGILE